MMGDLWDVVGVCGMVHGAAKLKVNKLKEILLLLSPALLESLLLPFLLLLFPLLPFPPLLLQE